MIAAFCLCFLYALVIPPFLPQWEVLFFAPFLITALFKMQTLSFLFLALGTGLFNDLLSSETPFGFYALISCVSLWIVRFWKNLFLKDEMLTLLLFTLLFVLVHTLLEALLAPLFRLPPFLSWSWALFHLFLFPLLNVIYAAFFVLLPIKSYISRRTSLSASKESLD